jgi:protein subunit release factor A
MPGYHLQLFKLMAQMEVERDILVTLTQEAEAEALEELVAVVFTTEEMDFCYRGIQLDMALEEEDQDTQAILGQDHEEMVGEMLALEQEVPLHLLPTHKKMEQQE